MQKGQKVGMAVVDVEVGRNSMLIKEKDMTVR
jgi:hypothetical protein